MQTLCLCMPASAQQELKNFYYRSVVADGRAFLVHRTSQRVFDSSGRIVAVSCLIPFNASNTQPSPNSPYRHYLSLPRFHPTHQLSIDFSFHAPFFVSKNALAFCLPLFVYNFLCRSPLAFFILPLLNVLLIAMCTHTHTHRSRPSRRLSHRRSMTLLSLAITFVVSIQPLVIIGQAIGCWPKQMQIVTVPSQPWLPLL
jgi:hypothetical protein